MKHRAHAWRAMRQPSYRLYFAGQAVSILGNWIQQVALGWLVYRLSGSAMLLGMVAFLAQIPQLVVSPLAGIIIDRSNIRHLMMLVQLGMLLQAVCLAVLTWAGLVTPWHILVAAGVFGVLNSFDVPLRHAYTSQLVQDRQDLPNAIALNSLFFNLARFIGPPLAGAILAQTSEAACFALNALSFVAIIGVMSHLRTNPQAHSSAAFGDAMCEGVAFVRQSFSVRHILWQVALLNFLAANYIPLMPAFARDVFRGGPGALGVLLGCAGAGALLASLTLASRRSVRGLSGTVAFANLLAAFSLIAFALSSDIWLANVMLFLLGFALVSGNASSNTILQTIVPEHLRGRVLSLYSAANLGSAALGGLVSGALADHCGPGETLILMGILLIAAALFFFFRLELFRMYLRPIYARLGIKHPNMGKES